MPSAASWSGSPFVKGSTESMRMALLTFSLIGLQFTWGIEMTYCTPYLLQLGLTKSKTSLVWVAGPLSGLIMQPVVGAITDRSTSKYGRRRPFMIGGSVLVGAGLLLLGWTSELVGLFISEEASRREITILVAVLSIYLVDFAVNAVQACCRSLIVDTLPISEQQLGSAWASRMTGAGHLIGYMIGSCNVGAVAGQIFGIADNQQFKAMIIIATSALLIAVGVTSNAVTERILLPSPDVTSPKTEAESMFGVLKSLVNRTLNLPPRIQAICWVQFWTWIGWFPFLFYGSTWVGETYYRYEHPAPPQGSSGPDDSHDALGNVGRLGSLALVIFSIVTFTSSIILPYLVKSPKSAGREKFTPRPPPSLSKTIQSLHMRATGLQPDLVTTWLLSNLFFAATLVWAPFVHSLAFATALVALAGIPWAVSSWAPFAEIGVEINRLASRESTANGAPNNVIFPSGGGRNGYAAVRPSMETDTNHDIEMEEARPHRRLLSDGILRLAHEDDDDDDTQPSTGELAGVYLGVLNVYTTLPQFVGTFVSWIVFTLLEPSKKDVSDDAPDHHKWLDVKKNAPNAIAICLFIGACCAAVAAEATRRLKRLD